MYFKPDSKTTTLSSSCLTTVFWTFILSAPFSSPTDNESRCSWWKPVTPSGCADLKTDSCGMCSTETARKHMRIFHHVQSICTKLWNCHFTPLIAQLNASRGLHLIFSRSTNFPANVFAPVKDVLVQLLIWEFPAIQGVIAPVSSRKLSSDAVSWACAMHQYWVTKDWPARSFRPFPR